MFHWLKVWRGLAPPLYKWIPYDLWTYHSEWREQYKIIAYDRQKNLVKVDFL